MATRFEELDAQLDGIHTVIEDPDRIGGPEEFLNKLRAMARDLHQTTELLTVEDFAEEYAEEDVEDGDPGDDEGEGELLA
jgi:hypothetical protein